MKRALLLFLGLSTHVFGAGLDRYAQLVVSDSAATSRVSVRVTYLGTNGYQFESKGHALLVDLYFSRVNLSRVAFGLQIEPDLVRIEQAMKHLAPNPDAILVTHGHFDHLLDVPIIMSKTNARLIATAAALNLVRRAGARSGDAVTAGEVRQVGPWKIRILPAAHDRLFGKVPFDGREPSGSRPPRRAADWICGEPLAFLIEMDGQRIYIDSGGTAAQLPPNKHVDLAILGHGFARFTRTITWSARTPGTALYSAKPPG